MDCTNTADETQVQEVGLLGSLDQEWLKLPLTIMRDAGPAVQTLGGLLKITTKETFVPVEDIARRARLPITTVRKHLLALNRGGWLDHHGRQRTRAGYLRRTATITLPKKTRDAIEPYGVLPWWTCCSIRGVGRLHWSTKAVLSVVMARLCSLKAAVEQQDGHGLDADDIVGSIENMGDDRFLFGLDWLARQTGLSRDSVVQAKRRLHKLKIVSWSGQSPTRGEDTPKDSLEPNWEFRVVVTPAGEGMVRVTFRGGSKSGQ